MNPAPWLLASTNVDALRYDVARAAAAEWRRVPLPTRARRLGRVADALLEREGELVELIGRENGKRPVEALGHEIGASVANIRWMCGAGLAELRPRAVPIPLMPHRKAEQIREPWGVVLVISPWNFPLSIPLGHVVAGLLSGNAVVLKPSEITPEIGNAIESLLAPAGLPPALFSVVQGDGRVGAALVAAKPDKVFFTGSLATGRKVMQAAAEHPIPVCMELGGVDAMIVLDDADLDFASSAAVWGGFFNGGQVCASVERLLVQESVREAFIARVVAKANELEPATDLGRITADKQREVYDRHLADARERGLQIRCGGEYVGPRTLAPTVIDGAGIEEAAVYREETFGPIIAAAGFRSDADAAARHNALWSGLTVSIFSGNEGRARALAERLDAGLVSINDVAATLHAVPELPWGGVGSSGFGRSHGAEGMLEFSWSKVVDQPRGAHLDFKRPWWFPYDATQTEVLRQHTRLLGARTVAEGVRAAGKLGASVAKLLFKRPRT
jgi:succinate-semialdehyde dehydrogenase/glutarate-semialdehyde dehydrogenase